MKGDKMETLERLEKREIKELISKGWITHDSMWFVHCLQEFGIEKTNKVNRAAVRSMSAIEVGRLKKALGVTKDTFDTFDELMAFITESMDIVLADFMKVKFNSPSKNILHWEMEKDKCFAYKGMCKLGIADQYECGVLHRIECWLDTLNIPYTMTPKVKKCLMHSKGECTGDFIIDLP